MGIAGILGCGSQPTTNLPKTYEVRGVVLEASGEPAQGGSIEFTPKQPGGQKFLGIIGPKGEFTARTIAAEGATAGAPEGTYTAVVVPAISNQPTEQHAVRPISIREEVTVMAAGENSFTIRLPPPAR